MSKKKEKEQKQQESKTNLDKNAIIPDKNLIKAERLFIASLNKNFRLKNLNQILLTSYFKESLISKIIKKDDVLFFDLYGKKEGFKVLRIENEEAKLNEEIAEINYMITSNTKFYIVDETPSELSENKSEKMKNEKLMKLAGLDAKLNEIIKIIRTTFQFSESLNIAPIKGIIIHGPSGIGKSSILKKISQELKEFFFLKIEINKLLTKFFGDSEKQIHEIFEEAKKMQPCVIFFDDLHLICKKELGKENSASLTHALCTELDELQNNNKIIVIATTSQITDVDLNLRRSGRFDKEVKIEIPHNKERLSILNLYLSDISHSLQENEIKEINDNLNGFTGSDIISLLRESLIKSFETLSISSSPVLTKKEIENALAEIQPSGLKDLILEIPKILWTDIGGYDNIKFQIKQVVEWPLKNPEAFERMGIKPSKGILLYGPPGCSKTMIAKAIATESSLNFIAIKGPELFSKYVGDSEKAIRELFKRARLCSPSIIFFDEIDALATQRSASTDVSDRVLCQLLTEMDGVETLKHVIVIAATNRPDIIDIGLTRPGRFDHLIYIPPPDLNCRKEIFKLNIIGNKMPVSEVDIDALANKTEGFSGAEICLICREAGLHALSRDINEKNIYMSDFISALSKIKPRITNEMISYYESFEAKRKLV